MRKGEKTTSDESQDALIDHGPFSGTAQSALDAYQSLPDAKVLVEGMKLAQTARGSLERENEAKREAWRIRLEMAKSWDSNTFGSVMAMLHGRHESVAEASRRSHPILGPIWEVLYEDRLPRWKQTRTKAEEKATARKEISERNKRLKPKHREGARVTNQKMDSLRMTKCVDLFVDWLAEQKREFDKSAIKDFPKQEGIGLKTAQSFLEELLDSNTKPSVREELLKRIREKCFQHAEQESIDECLATLKKHANG